MTAAIHPTTVDGLRLRRILGRDLWLPPRRFGPDGWRLNRIDGAASVIVTAAPFDDVDWIHASMAGTDKPPTYADLVLLRRAVFGDGWAYQVFAPAAEHVNIHEHALHLWGRADGRPVLPEFSAGVGSI